MTEINEQTGTMVFASLGLTSPDDTGSAEHRAIFDLLVDSFDTGDHAYADDMGDDPVEYAYGMLDEVISWAQEMRRQITIAQRDAKRAAEPQPCNEIVHPWDWEPGQTRWVCTAPRGTEHSHADGLVNGTLRELRPEEAVTPEDATGCIYLA